MDSYSVADESTSDFWEVNSQVSISSQPHSHIAYSSTHLNLSFNILFSLLCTYYIRILNILISVLINRHTSISSII
jgi:hypothetical protein